MSLIKSSYRFPTDVPCNLCSDKMSTVVCRRHMREKGVHVLTMLRFCEDCKANRNDECDKLEEERFAASLQRGKDLAEKNWQEHGVYTNVEGADGPSKFFGYRKTDDGFLEPITAGSGPAAPVIEKIDKLFDRKGEWRADVEGTLVRAQQIIDEAEDLSDPEREFYSLKVNQFAEMAASMGGEQ